MIPATATSVPFLSLTRSVLPEERTPDQDALVGSASLALTGLERECVEEFSDPKKEYKNYVKSLPEDREEEMRRSMDRAIVLGKGGTALGGAVAGFLVGGANGAILSTIALVGGLPAFIPTVGVLGSVFAIAGGIKGGIDGYKKGASVGEHIRITMVNSSEECVRWISQRCHQVAFPALMQFIRPEDRPRFRVGCALTGRWMQDPVEAPDHRVYERSAIVSRLKEEGISPFTGERMSIWSLSRKPSYYRNMFDAMRRNYNEKVSQREHVVTEWENRDQDTELSEFHVEGVAPEETGQILRFHNMGERRLKTTAHALSTEVLGRDGVADEVADAVTDFLTKTATKAPARV
jgi:hypothetical protein